MPDYCPDPCGSISLKARARSPGLHLGWSAVTVVSLRSASSRLVNQTLAKLGCQQVKSMRALLLAAGRTPPVKAALSDRNEHRKS
jgi:hypothetical protein